MPQEGNKSKKRRYLQVIFRLVLTLLLIGAIVGSIKAYEMKGALTREQKYIFNSLIIMLSLILAINMTIAHSQVVFLLKDGIIRKAPYDNNHWPFRFARKFNKISGLRSSLSFMLSEMKPNTPRQKGSITVASLFIVVWLVFNLSVAVAIALIGLTYSLEEGGIGRHIGNISVVNTKHFFADANDLNDPERITERFTSKLYADVSIAYANKRPSDDRPDDEFEVLELEGSWGYNFREMDPGRKIILRSDRYVTTSASCRALRIQQFDESTSTLVYIEDDGSLQKVTPIYLRNGSTTYMSSMREDYSIYDCGSRCGWLAVMEVVSLTDFSDAWLYDCNSTVHEVEGAYLPEHEISDHMAVIAATSLTQSGIIDESGRSFAYYAGKVKWGKRMEGNPRAMEKVVSRFSVGCIAAMDQLNPRVIIPGQQPWKGVLLKVRWPRLIAVLVVIGSLQLIAASSSIYWHRMSSKSNASPQNLGVSLAGSGVAGQGIALNPVANYTMQSPGGSAHPTSPSAPYSYPQITSPLMSSGPPPPPNYSQQDGTEYTRRRMMYH
ncbi:hypothetical protein BDZ91DRAFT_290772 [Kalaharituber pfeilii]|nr:hypothetical protein BDZ91DRAFT_290772 [Kalaharituber pfeilii]